jgi:hypothetical protein
MPVLCSNPSMPKIRGPAEGWSSEGIGLLGTSFVLGPLSILCHKEWALGTGRVVPEQRRKAVGIHPATSAEHNLLLKIVKSYTPYPAPSQHGAHLSTSGLCAIFSLPPGAI